MIKAVRSIISRVVGRLPRFPEMDKQTLLWGGGAAVIIGVSAASSQFLVGEAIFNSAIISAKAETNRTLKHNVENVKALETNVNRLLADEVLAPLRADEGDNNFRVVLDALPTTGDPITFANSLQSVIVKHPGVTIAKLSTDERKDIPGGALHDSAPRTLRFSVEIGGEYAAIKAVLGDIEKSIRPIHITSLSVTEGTQKLSAKIAGVTYYQPEKSLKLKAESVERP
jgi:hypothetical protein